MVDFLLPRVFDCLCDEGAEAQRPAEESQNLSIQLLTFLLEANTEFTKTIQKPSENPLWDYKDVISDTLLSILANETRFSVQLRYMSTSAIKLMLTLPLFDDMEIRASFESLCHCLLTENDDRVRVGIIGIVAAGVHRVNYLVEVFVVPLIRNIPETESWSNRFLEVLQLLALVPEFVPHILPVFAKKVSELLEQVKMGTVEGVREVAATTTHSITPYLLSLKKLFASSEESRRFYALNFLHSHFLALDNDDACRGWVVDGNTTPPPWWTLFCDIFETCVSDVMLGGGEIGDMATLWSTRSVVFLEKAATLNLFVDFLVCLFIIFRMKIRSHAVLFIFLSCVLWTQKFVPPPAAW